MVNIKEEKIQKARKNLETACSMLGWEEKDDTDRALHAKNFIKAYKIAEKEYNQEFELAMAKVAVIGNQKDYLKDTLNAVGDYIEKVERDKLRAIDNNKEETIKYASYILDRIAGLCYAREERRKQPDKDLF